MPALNPNTLTVGEACELLARQPLAEARGTFAELRRLGITPSPVVMYQSGVDAPSFGIVFSGGAVLFDWNLTLGSAAPANPPTPGMRIQITRIRIDNPGAKTAAGLVALNLNVTAGGGDLSGSLGPQYRSRPAQDSAAFPLGGSANLAAVAAGKTLWQGLLWVPTVVANPPGAYPLFFDLGNSAEQEPPTLTVPAFAAGAAPALGLQLVAAVPFGVGGSLTGLASICGAIEYIELPAIS